MLVCVTLHVFSEAPRRLQRACILIGEHFSGFRTMSCDSRQVGAHRRKDLDVILLGRFQFRARILSPPRLTFTSHLHASPPHHSFPRQTYNFTLARHPSTIMAPITAPADDLPGILATLRAHEPLNYLEREKKNLFMSDCFLYPPDAPQVFVKYDCDRKRIFQQAATQSFLYDNFKCPGYRIPKVLRVHVRHSFHRTSTTHKLANG